MYKKTVYTFLLGAVSFTLCAQEEKKEDLNRELTLEREYDPSVQDANKVNTLPAVKEPEVKKTAIDYAEYNIPASPEKELNVLPSGRIMADIDYNKRRGYFNFGIGTHLNINGDLGYHILTTEQDKLNIYYSHRSTNGNVKYLQNDEKVKAKLNDNLGGINYRHNFSRSAFNLGAKFGYSGFNYYGYTPATNRDLDTNQGNQEIGLRIGFESTDDDPMGYLIDLDYTNFTQKYGYSKELDGLTENAVSLKGKLSAAISGDQSVGAEAKLDYFNYSLPASMKEFFYNYAEVTVNPYYKIEDSDWHVKLGANIMFTTGDHKKFFVSPNIYADYVVADRTLLYLDATGRIRSNSAYQLAQQNRYINLPASTISSRTWLDGTIGVKSGVAPGFWFHIFGGYSITDDDAFITQYIPTSGFGNLSSVMHINSKVFKAGLDLKYAYQKLFDARFKLVYNNWNLDKVKDAGGREYEFRPYGKPELEMNIGLDVTPIEKLSVSFDYCLASSRYGLFGSEEFKLKNINELNITGNYNLNDTFGGFIKVTNLLGQKYELLYGYPAQGISAMIGFNLNF